MALNLHGYEEKVGEAVKEFWHARKVFGVRSGKTLDGFLNLLKWVVTEHGMPEAQFVTGRTAQVPGFFRPTKSWDFLVFNKGILVAAIELKSIADSFSKNFNNRSEEALGSGVDIKEAFEEQAFEGLTRLFTGYVILVEECSETASNVKIQMPYFRVMKEFMQEPENREAQYIRNKKGRFPYVNGINYMERFDILCKRLMQKRLYSAASVITSKESSPEEYGSVSAMTSILAFLATFASHIEAEVVIQEGN